MWAPFQVPVAQQTEWLITNQQAAGASPAGDTIHLLLRHIIYDAYALEAQQAFVNHQQSGGHAHCGYGDNL